MYPVKHNMYPVLAAHSYHYIDSIIVKLLNEILK